MNMSVPVPIGDVRSRPRRVRARAPQLRRRTAFGPNPGNLAMWVYAPRRPASGAPLVVVLHGGAQSARDYAKGAGWLALAERHGFALVCPEQTTANNAQRCFNWFRPEDTQRGHGEAASIRAMIAAAKTEFASDSERIFVTGLSAGGAMACVMLAAYPEVFAGGGIIAGIAYGEASNLGAAFSAMARCPEKDGTALAGAVRDASGHRGPWPRISIWHGSDDTIVAPANAEKIALQWSHLHGAAAKSSEEFGNRTRTVWRAQLRPVVELHTIEGLSHGTPIAVTGHGAARVPGPFFLDAGICSSEELLRFWDITGTPAAAIRRLGRAMLRLLETTSGG